MNVASKELCEKLFKLSRWDNTYFWWNRDEQRVPGKQMVVQSGKIFPSDFPAYDAGYLLRKLPYKVDLRQLRNGWSASFSNNSYRRFGDERRDAYGKADIPEDALCELSIQLFEQEILTKEGK